MSTKMSKLTFRAKPLDGPMPVYINEDLQDLQDYSAIDRAVPQMPSGMYEEEECEHHLQRAICSGLIIPTPEFTDVSEELVYDRLYPPDFKIPSELVHMQSFAMDQDFPDYDMDSEDEMWFSSQKSKLEITPRKFEEMMDRLEKGSVQTVLSEQQAKALLKDDDDIILAVYEYWLNKRLKTQHPLVPSVCTKHHPRTASNNPYVAFIRQTDKMQTRKHRKNGETSYEKMLKLKTDLTRAVTLLEMIKRREKTKREVLHLTVEVFEKRYQAGDFSGQLLAEVSTVKPCSRPAFAPLFPNQFSVNHQNWPSKDEPLPRKEKRQYKKRKHKASQGVVGGMGGSAGLGRRTSGSTASAAAAAGLTAVGGADIMEMDGLSSDDGDASSSLLSGVAVSDDDDSGADTSEGPFAFRRRKNCSYHAPLPPGQGNWPWCSREEGGLADRRYRYCLTSLTSPPPAHCLGFARRRVGRGGRVILDRAHTPMDDVFRSLDFTILDSKDKQKSQQRSPSKQLNQPQPTKVNWYQSCEQQKSRGDDHGDQGVRKHLWRSEDANSLPHQKQSEGHESNPGQLMEEQRPCSQERGEDQNYDLLAEIRNEWLHFRPETQNVMDLNALRFEVDAANSSAAPTEMSVLDVLCNMPGSIVDTGDIDLSNRCGTDVADLFREDAATQTIRQTTPPHQDTFDHYRLFSPQKKNEPLSFDEGVIGCSQFNIYPGSGSLKTSLPQTWAPISTASLLAPGPGRPQATSSASRTTHQHRKQDRHHQLHQSYSLCSASGSSSSNNPQPLSNGVSIIPASVSAVLSANAGLLRQGLSNGPAGPVTSVATIGSPSMRKRAIPVYIKQELMEESVDRPNETFNCVNYVGGAGSSLAEGAASGLRASTGSGDLGTTASAACGEQQKLKSSTASQQQVLMEVT